MVKRNLYLRYDLKNIVLTTVQRNVFFLLPENVVLVIVEQDDASLVRELALRRILKARKETKGTKVHASTYYDLINCLGEGKVTKPTKAIQYTDIEIAN